MLIYYDKENDWLLFTLETKDFIEGKGHKFIKELTKVLQKYPDNYLTDELDTKHKKVIIYIIDMNLEIIKSFIKLYKKYFRADYIKQSIKIV